MVSPPSETFFYKYPILGRGALIFCCCQLDSSKMTSSRTAAVCPCRSQRTLLRHTYYSLAVLVDKPRDASASVAHGCNCEFAATLCCISETVKDSDRVTIKCECEYEVVCDLSNGVIFYSRDAMLARVIEIVTCLSVRLSVRPSVTRRYCVKTKKASGMISSPSGSTKTLVF